MDCRRAFETDLADFVASGGASEWADFRAHYARCADCAAEVRAWTELHAALGGGAAHPGAEELLRFETGTLAPQARGTIEHHLAGCPSCRDELRALRGFDFARLGTTPEAVAPRSRLGFLRLARATVVHPAFAYAMVLLLLVPTVVRRFPSPARENAVSADRPKAKGEEAKEDLADRRQSFERARRVAKEAAPTGAQPAAPASEPALLGRAEAELLPLRPDRAAEIRVDDLVSAARLAVPLPAAHGDRVEVRVISEDGAREMRERFSPAPADQRVELALPAAWLTPGTYRVELHASRVDTFVLRVTP